MKKCDVGGQAVIEGVMMRGTKGIATAVRKESGEIIVEFNDNKPFTKKHPKVNIPFLRGVINLGESLYIGVKALNYSSSIFQETEEEPGKFEKWLQDKVGGKLDNIIMIFTMILSFFLAIGIFVGIPTLMASIFQKVGLSSVLLNLIEAIIRIGILILYMWAIGKMEDIRRTFEYHGAEHKTIFCYEHEEDLTVENVKKESRFHPRCGTNFLFLVMFVSVLVFAFTGWGSILERLALRIILIPIIAGISYEIIKWLGKSNNKIARIVAYPGLQLQKLTTREPDSEQIEVAIEALMVSEGMEIKKTIQSLVQMGVNILKDSEMARLDSQIILAYVLKKDKLYVISNYDKEITIDIQDKFLELIEKRRRKMPIKYITKQCEFMGLDFHVEEGVLIPRPDTEILVEEVLKNIEEKEEITVCDLCCGSGAIGISLAHYRENIIVDEIDYYVVPEKVTKLNIKKNNIYDRVKFINSDLFKECILQEKKYNIIVSNPPYIKTKEINNLMKDVKDYEPALALDGGKDGLEFYRRIIEESKNVLEDDGILAFEIGYNQAEEVKSLMELNGYGFVKVVKDLAGLDRVVIGKSIC